MQILQTNINYNNPIAFQSRRADIRRLNDLSKLVTREFPMQSNTKMDRIKSTNSAKGYAFYRYIEALISEMRGFLSISQNKSEKHIKTLDTIKMLKVGNCNESADVGYTVLKLNGYKNVQKMRVCAYNPETDNVRVLTHSVVGIDFTKPLEKQPHDLQRPLYYRDKNAKVMDTWLGFCDTERNAALVYKLDEEFGAKLKDGEKICFTPSDDSNPLSNNDLIYLRHKYPSLTNEKESLISKIKWHLMDKTKYKYEPFSILIKESHRTNNKLKSALSHEELLKLYNPMG